MLAALFIAAGISTVEASAYDLDRMTMQLLNRELNGTQDTSDIAAWRQGRVPYNSAALKKNTAESTVYSGGCSYYAASYMLAKMGVLDVAGGENPDTVIEKMEAVDGWLTFGKMDYTRINEAFPEVTCHAYKAGFASSDFSAQLDEIRNLMAQGYFVILCIDGPGSQGHYIFVDEVTEDGDMVIGDSAYEGTAWSDYFAIAGFYLVDYSIFTCEGRTPDDCPPLYEYNKEELSREAVSPAHIDTSPYNGMATNIQWLLNTDETILADETLFLDENDEESAFIALPDGRRMRLKAAE